jgi:predicted TIM-barrel fold metal-dependent hydrolase
MLPIIVDPHHHFVDPVNNEFQKFLKELNVTPYLPDDYNNDSVSVPVYKSVHVEAMPDDGVKEALWVTGLAKNEKSKIGGIVAYCDLTSADASKHLIDLVNSSSLVCGIRMILDYDGEYDGGVNATHIACKNHNTDYLRDESGPALQFEKGFALLEEHNLSFDLQCCPAQLPAAASLFSRYPNINVCVNHMGKLQGLCLNANRGNRHDDRRLTEWRAGMKALSALPQVYVKLSMLGYCVPNWCGDLYKESFLKSLVLEVIDLFGPQRCMFASNWWGPLSDSDRSSSSSSSSSGGSGPISMCELYSKYQQWVSHMSVEDQRALFASTAAKFYKIDISTASSSLLASEPASAAVSRKARILVVGAGWWSQGELHIHTHF